MPLKRKRSRLKKPAPKRTPKPISSFHHRPLKRPIPANRMTAGVSYEGWQCKNEGCHKVIAIAATASRGGKVLLQDADDYIAEMRCPHCGSAQEHRWNARADLVHESVLTP